MYVIVNPDTRAQHGKVYADQATAVEAREKAIETYGITTAFQVYKLAERKES